MGSRRPRLELPLPLVSDRPGTWAFDTMSRRIRTDILARIYRENPTMPPWCGKRLGALEAELCEASTTALRWLEDDGEEDVAVWNDQILKPFVEREATWLSAPWLVTEFYFYRRVLQCVGWFTGEGGDPFAMQKELGVTSAMDSMSMLAERVLGIVENPLRSSEEFRTMVVTALWGNRMDLSIWPVGGDRSAEDSFRDIVSSGSKMILADDFEKLWRYLTGDGWGLLPKERVDIVVDNAGFELFCDFCLADYLVSVGLAKFCVIQLKGHPTFVSDAMEKDARFMMECMRGSGRDALVKAAERWLRHVESGRWKMREDRFWAQGSAFWEMPDMIFDELRRTSALTFVKGDANYRRLLGDLAWEFNAAFSDIASYFPTPVCALRTLKAEIGCGMSSEAISMAESLDPKWLVSGKWGVIQFCEPVEGDV